MQVGRKLFVNLIPTRKIAKKGKKGPKKIPIKNVKIVLYFQGQN